MNVVRWMDGIEAGDGVHVFVQGDATFDARTLQSAVDAYDGTLRISVLANPRIRWHLFDAGGAPIDVPGLWHHDGVKGWRRDDTHEHIVGRQNMPDVLTVSPVLMVGTVDQARDWRAIVARGEARAIRI